MKLRTSIIAKILAWILIAVSGLCLVGSGLLVVAMESSGFYDRTFADIREERFATYNDRYSARVLEYLYAEENSNQEYFANRNFRYGVIEANFLSELESMDLNDQSNYIDSNFDFEKDLALEDLHIFQCTINENTIFESSYPDSLGGYYWIHNTIDSWYSYAFEQIVYDVETGIFYIEAAEQYFPIPKVVFHISNDKGDIISQGYEFDREVSAYKPVDVIRNVSFGNQQYKSILEVDVHTDATTAEILNLLAEINVSSKKGGISFKWLEGYGLSTMDWGFIGFSNGLDGFDTQTYDSETVYETEIMDTGSTVSSVMTSNLEVVYTSLGWDEAANNLNKEIYIDAPEMILYVRSSDMESNSYFVLSHQLDEYTYNADLTSGENDVFGTYDVVVGTLYSMRYQMFGIFFGCLAVFVAAFVFLCCAAGHRKGGDGLVESRINRVPLEIYAGAAGILLVSSIVLIDIISEEITGFGDVFWIVLMIAIVLFAGLLLTAAALEVVTRIKLRIFWKRTICYWVISKMLRGCKIFWKFMLEHIGMAVRMILIFAVIFFGEFLLLGIANGYGGIGVLMLLIEKVLLFIIMLVVVMQLQKLKEAGKHVASGNLNHKIDTRNMFWDFKEHGENLNSIGEGLAIAVDERMKSERFKTELITNVSHDIKTPLTSIINYVDLMQKEEVNNEKIEEYLEVLERQSKRLKKLLEDLLEASKASAGTLQVAFETLEAGVFMVQTVGEFEEKTKAQNLELIIKKPEEPVYINADGRHFWRVIDNLMNNICKYAQPNTRVYINLEATKEEVYIMFRNTSRYPLNITSEELMERFVRGDESRHTEGSGLGLSIAQSLMELMHGRFELIVDGDLFKVILTFDRCYNR